MAHITPNIQEFGSLSSTNDKAREIAKENGEGTIVVCREQTHGRGSSHRKWHSPLGGLYLSALLYPSRPSGLTELPILAGVAMNQAVREVLPKSCDVTVKWPNDCLVNGRKVGGVLCESLGEDYFHLCVVGLGLNVNIAPIELTPFQSNPFGATSFTAEVTQGRFELAEVQKVLITKLMDLYELYKQDGFQPIRFLWEKNCSFVGKKIEVRDSGWRNLSEEEKQKAPSLVGVCLGVDETGALIVTNAAGQKRTLVTGEITCCWS